MHGVLSAEHLRNIQALTDTALARLDVEDLLGERLDRVREILGADTAAVLSVEEASNELVARAARRIEEVPLLTGGKLIGVLHVGTLKERSFSQGDVELLELVAERVAFATQTRLLEVERASASRSARGTELGDSRGICASSSWPSISLWRPTISTASSIAWPPST